MNALTVIQPPAFTMGDIERVAMAIAKGGLFGSSDPNAVLTLCLLAQAEGQHPAVVFRDYHIIKGKPAKKADAMLRDFVSAGGKVEWHALTDEVADATFSHPHGGTIRIDWTMQRARTAQLTTDMWRKYPRQMLRSRVISEGVRTVYPGATSGLYEVGEVEDIVTQQPLVAQRIEPLTDGGQSDEREVSPPVEPHVDETSLPDAAVFPTGPAKNITGMKGLARALWREIESCGDTDQLNCLLDVPDNKALLKQMSELENANHREIWEGDGKDNPGIAGLITRKETEFAQHMVALGRT